MTVVSHDPRTGRPLPPVEDSTADELDAAVDAASRAARAVAGSPPSVRQTWLRAVADALESEADELAGVADTETALGRTRLTAEVHRAAWQLRFYADVAGEGSFLGATIDRATSQTPDLARMNVPLGPVAVFGASNVPFTHGVVGHDVSTAIASGCPVVVKAHPAHLGLSRRLADLAGRALASAGAPDGLFQLVVGHQVGIDLVRHPGIAAVAFTGSQQGGLALWRVANEREVVIPVFAEMGTVNPVVVLPSATADMASLADAFVGSFTIASGQVCTKPGLLLAPRGIGAAREVADALDRARVEPVMLTESVAAGVETGLRDLVAAGATTVLRVDRDAPGWSAPAAVLEVSLDQVRRGSRLLEECFGPVTLVCEYESLDEVHRALAELQGSLAASVFAAPDDPDPEVARLVEVLTAGAGRVVVNGWPTGVAAGWAQHHGGPWPSTTRPDSTSVGAGGLHRFLRPVAFQTVPAAWLPPALQESNPWGLPRRVDGAWQVPDRSV